MATPTTPKQKTKHTAIRLTDDDLALIEQLKKDYGLTSTLQAIRLALRLAQLERWPVNQDRGSP